MHNVGELKSALEKAEEKYKSAKTKLMNSADDPTNIGKAAQEANDAWLEFKKVESAITNCLIIKKLGDLYGCQ